MKKINEILTDFGYRALIHDKELIINYNDIKNNTTERKITLKSVKRIFDDYLLTAYCHLRKSNRTFKLSNISLLVDNSSGEVIDNFSDYFSTLDIIEIVEEDSNYEKYYTEDYFTEIFKRRESKFNNNSLDKLCSLFEYEEGSIEVKKTRLSIEYYNKEKDEILKISRELIEIDRNGGYEFNLFFHWIDNKDILYVDIEDIKSIYDNDNEHYIDDLPEYLYQLCSESPYFITNNIYKDTMQEIDILVFLAKADGKMVKGERNLIVEYLFKQYPQLDKNILDDLIKKHKVTNNRFKESVKYIKSNKSDSLESLNQTMKEIIDIDKEIDPMEVTTMELFSKL